MDADFFPSSFTASDIGLKLSYKFENNIFVGGYYDYFNISENGLDIEISSYGLSGGYRTDKLNVEGFVGHSENSRNLPSDADQIDYGLNVQYVISPRASVGGHIVHSDISGGAINRDLTSLGIGGRFDIGRGWTGFGGVSRFELGISNADVMIYGIGIGYDLEQIAGVPAYVSLELERASISGPLPDVDVDTINLGVTIPLGNRDNPIPLNSQASSSMKGRHNGIATLFNGARFF